MTATSLSFVGRPVSRVVVVGAGNVGSHVVPQLARLSAVKEVLIVDPDRYEQTNLSHQAIQPRDVGQLKARVQQRLLRRLAPRLSVEAACVRVQDLPWGQLNAAVIVSCLDSRVARQFVNEIAWRCGCLLIDTAVDAAGRLARCNVYQPAEEAPCLECAWNDHDYAALEQTLACGRPASATPTAAPASLGAVAAAYAASECDKALSADWEHLATGRQVLLDLRHHRQLVTRLTHNPRCRFDHGTWRIEILAGVTERSALRDLRMAVERCVGARTTAWRVAGRTFGRDLACLACGQITTRPVHIAGRSAAAHARCSQCGQSLSAVGFHGQEWQPWDELGARSWRRTLRSWGVRAHDLLGVQDAAGTSYFQVAATTRHGKVDPKLPVASETLPLA